MTINHDEVIYCYTHHGWSIHRIARYLDKSPSRIQAILAEHDIPRRPQGRPRTINHALARELTTRLSSPTRVAAILGCHRTSIYDTFKDTQHHA